MKTRFTLAASALAIAATPLLAKSPDDAALDRLLDGRTAGQAVPCLTLSRVRTSTVVDGVAIVYRVGNILYVNRPRVGADRLDQDDTIVNRTAATQICEGDPVQTQDRFTGTLRGAITLGEFVPYRRDG
jgi:hypothetical protein